MLKRVVGIAGVSLLCLAGTAKATETGATLLARCDGDIANQSLCLGYIAGMIHGMDIMRQYMGKPACVPGGVSSYERRDHVVSYLRAHPTEAARDSDIAVAGAIAAVWQCTK